MKRLTVILGGLLGAQLALALILSFFGADYGTFKAKEPLLKFDAAKVDAIEIDESGGNSVKLAKKDGKWTIPALAGFPADGAKVDTLLAKMAGLKKGWPVATTSDAEKRFKVADDTHERRILLKSGGWTMAGLFLGTSPAFKQSHARDENDTKIYNVAFASYDAGTRGEDWMDRSVVDIPEDQIASISAGGVTLERKDKNFVIPGLAAGEKLNETAIWKLAGAVSHPAFDAVEGKGPEALAKVNNPDIEVKIKRTKGADVDLKYKKEAAGSSYLFASSANDFVFRVAEGSIEPVVKAKREAFVQEPKPKAEAQAPTAKPEDKKSPPAEGEQAATQPQEPQPPKTGG